MSLTKGTPASSQIITLERMLAERDAEIEKLQKYRDWHDEVMAQRTIGSISNTGRRVLKKGQVAQIFPVGDIGYPRTDVIMRPAKIKEKKE